MQMVQKRFPKRKYSHITGGEEDENNVNEDDHDDNGTRSSPKKKHKTDAIVPAKRVYAKFRDIITTGTARQIS